VNNPVGPVLSRTVQTAASHGNASGCASSAASGYGGDGGGGDGGGDAETLHVPLLESDVDRQVTDAGSTQFRSSVQPIQQFDGR